MADHDLIRLRRPKQGNFALVLDGHPHTTVRRSPSTRNSSNPKASNYRALGRLIGLCRPSGLKFANLFAVRCSSTPLYSFAPEIITARSTVRVELQSESHFKRHMRVIPEGKIIPVGLTDGGSSAHLLPRHVRPTYCAVQRFLRLTRCFLALAASQDGENPCWLYR